MIINFEVNTIIENMRKKNNKMSYFPEASN